MPSPPRHSVRSSAVAALRRRARWRRSRRCGRRARPPRAGTPPAPPASPPRWPRTAPPRDARRLVEPATWKTRETPLQRPPHRAPVGQVGDRRLDVEPRQRVEVRGRPHGHADVVAAGHERPRDVRSDEPGRAGDEGGRHGSPRLQALRSPPMDRVAVVTDTTHYLPRDLVTRLDLHQVSLYVTFEGKTEREADITDLADFYTRLSASSEMPSTSQPSVGDFLAVYEPLLEAGRDIVSIHLSAGISGTFTAAEQARDQLVERGIDPERIVVLDSATACAGLGMLAMAAASVAARRRQRRRGGRGRPGLPARPEGLVRGRHARVPAPRRPRRRRPGVARLDAEDQADPLDRVGDPADRARAHVGARVRAPDRVPDRRATTTAATRSSSSTSTRPTRPSGWSSAGGRSTAASPRWSPRSAPSSAPTWGRGCSGSRGCGEACCTRAARLVLFEPGAVVVARARGVDALELGPGLGGQRGDGPAETAELGGHGSRIAAARAAQHGASRRPGVQGKLLARCRRRAAAAGARRGPRRPAPCRASGPACRPAAAATGSSPGRSRSRGGRAPPRSGGPRRPRR